MLLRTTIHQLPPNRKCCDPKCLEFGPLIQVTAIPAVSTSFIYDVVGFETGTYLWLLSTGVLLYHMGVRSSTGDVLKELLALCS